MEQIRAGKLPFHESDFGEALQCYWESLFFRQYPEIAMLALCGNDPAALEQMAALLLDGQKLSAPEAFLGLFLRLAALRYEDAGILYGKIRLAQVLLQKKRTEEAAAIVKELEELGMEENAELAELRARLREGL